MTFSAVTFCVLPLILPPNTKKHLMITNVTNVPLIFTLAFHDSLLFLLCHDKATERRKIIYFYECAGRSEQTSDKCLNHKKGIWSKFSYKKFLTSFMRREKEMKGIALITSNLFYSKFEWDFHLTSRWFIIPQEKYSTRTKYSFIGICIKDFSWKND